MAASAVSSNGNLDGRRVVVPEWMKSCAGTSVPGYGVASILELPLKDCAAGASALCCTSARRRLR